MIAAAALPTLVDRARSEGGLDRNMTDLAAYEAFVRNYQNAVFSVAVRILGNHADAEDITQEVFLKAYRRFEQLQQSPTAGGWLKTVATNLAINHLNRYRARWRNFSDNDPISEPVVTLESPHPRQEQIELALEQLPDAQRVPLVLYHFQDLTYEEIAGRLQVSLAKVKTDIHRGRATLRTLLERIDG